MNSENLSDKSRTIGPVKFGTTSLMVLTLLVAISFALRPLLLSLVLFAALVIFLTSIAVIFVASFFSSSDAGRLNIDCNPVIKISLKVLLVSVAMIAGSAVVLLIRVVLEK